jgi:hypothetical protein
MEPPMGWLLTRFFAFAICLLIGGVGTTAELPLTVTVSAAQTYLRAGPSDDFYPTERLAFGAPVEVWAFDDLGYCAVRPVQGSFSWMRRCDVEDAAASADAREIGWVGVVVTDAAVARVGSQLNDLRHVTQVALEAGERVRVREAFACQCALHGQTRI